MLIGLFVFLFICMVLYVGVLFVLIGMVLFMELNVVDLVVYVLCIVGEDRIVGLLLVGVIVGLIIVLLVVMFVFVCVFYLMSWDGLLLKRFLSVYKCL